MPFSCAEFWEIQSHVNWHPFLTKAGWPRLCNESAAHSFFTSCGHDTAGQSCDLACFSWGGGSMFQFETAGFEIKFLVCIQFALQPPAWFELSPWAHQQSREGVLGTSGIVFPFLFRLRELQMCVAHTLLRFNRFVSLLGLLIFHPRWWVLSKCSINQCTFNFIVKVSGLNFLSPLSCQECKFRWSRSTQKTERVWWPGGRPPARSAVCSWQEGHRQ